LSSRGNAKAAAASTGEGDQSVSSAPVSEGASTGKRATAVPVTTLAEYFRRKRYRPARFFSDLEQANIWWFSDEDRSAALDLSTELDQKFSRTLSLAAAAVQARGDRFRRPIFDFAWSSTELRLRQIPRLMGEELRHAPDASARFAAVARALRPRMEESRAAVTKTRASSGGRRTGSAAVVPATRASCRRLRRKSRRP
jgi:hypothetical protein